ncbi:MAG: class I SAM-dependent methyltransferase [bacterium]|nr:class I SAM-dependent methyltransferase [bacterium]
MTAKDDIGKIQERESKFWDRQIDSFAKDEKDLMVNEYNLNVLESFVFERLGDLKDKKVLDCGCGSGVLSTVLAKRGATVFSFDISHESINMTKKRAEANGVGNLVTPQVMSFEDLIYKDQYFDFAVGYFVLHHIDIDKGARELNRVLKKGGRAIFLENSSNNPFLTIARKFLTGRFGIPKHGSEDETPLSCKKIRQIGEVFSGDKKIYYKNFFFFRLIDEFIFKEKIKMITKLLKILDEVCYRVLPMLRKFGYLQIVEFNK